MRAGLPGASYEKTSGIDMGMQSPLMTVEGGIGEERGKIDAGRSMTAAAISGARRRLRRHRGLRVEGCKLALFEKWSSMAMRSQCSVTARSPRYGRRDTQGDQLVARLRDGPPRSIAGPQQPLAHEVVDALPIGGADSLRSAA